MGPDPLFGEKDTKCDVTDDFEEGNLRSKCKFGENCMILMVVLSRGEAYIWPLL